MAQRMLAQWQQHSAEETIYIILCTQACLCDWNWIKERFWEWREFFFVWASLCAVLFSQIKNILVVIPQCCTCHPSPHLFFMLPAGLSHGACFPYSYSERHLDHLTPSFVLFFFLPGHQQHKVIYLFAKQQNKTPHSKKCIMCAV